MDKILLFKRLSFLIIFLLICSCATTMSQGYKFSLIKPVQGEYTAIQDNSVGITLSPDSYSIGIIVVNLIQESIKINWDEVSFVDPTGTMHRVVHEGVKLVNSDQSQPPSIIPPGAKLVDSIVPTDYVHWGLKSGWSWETGWNYDRLFGNLEDLNMDFEFGVYLPIEIRGVKKEYNFKIKASPNQ